MKKKARDLKEGDKILVGGQWYTLVRAEEFPKGMIEVEEQSGQIAHFDPEREFPVEVRS